MFLSHAASGLVTAYATHKIWDKKDFNQNQRGLLYAFSTLCAVLPDFDLGLGLILNIPNHRDFFTHLPFLYITITAISLIASSVVEKKSRKFFLSGVFVFFIGTMTHMITDILGSSMKVFYPLSKIEIGILELNPLIKHHSLAVRYLSTPVLGLIEMGFILSAALILLFTLKKQKTTFKIASLSLLILSIISIVTTVFFIYF